MYGEQKSIKSRFFIVILHSVITGATECETWDYGAKAEK